MKEVRPHRRGRRHKFVAGRQRQLDDPVLGLTQNPTHQALRRVVLLWWWRLPLVARPLGGGYSVPRYSVRVLEVARVEMARFIRAMMWGQPARIAARTEVQQVQRLRGHGQQHVSDERNGSEEVPGDAHEYAAAIFFQLCRNPTSPVGQSMTVTQESVKRFVTPGAEKQIHCSRCFRRRS